MEIILLERIEHLGQMGDAVRVKPGYARNYLLPTKKAVRATAENRKRFEAQRSQLEATNLERRAEAEAVAAKLDGITVVLIRQAGESGQLYGSATARDIAEAVSDAGFTVARNQIRLNQPIKSLGLHKVGIGLHPEVIVTVIVNVARTPDEAETQQRTGAAITRTGAERREEEELAFEQQAQAMREAEESLEDSIEEALQAAAAAQPE
ncbi:MAG: 50S ribosomal protein L9 [Rhodospirillales bacterium]|nr:50S ribosomal protein L9 [Rhodospirillales bacterium]